VKPQGSSVASWRRQVDPSSPRERFLKPMRLLEKFGLFEYSAGTVGLYDRRIFPISRIGDRILGSILGKNLLAVTRKDDSLALVVANPNSMAPSLIGGRYNEAVGGNSVL
jgi:hypothetical protein